VHRAAAAAVRLAVALDVVGVWRESTARAARRLAAAYREPLSRPLELLLATMCCLRRKHVARQADSLLRWCLSGAGWLNRRRSPRNAVLLLDATAALGVVAAQRAARSTSTATLAKARCAQWSSGARVARRDVQLGGAAAAGRVQRVQLPRAVFEGTFAQLFRAVLAPSQAWPMRAEALLAFQRYAKFAADIGQCQSLLTSESTPLVLAHSESAAARGRRRRNSTRIGAARQRVGSGASQWMRRILISLAQLRELANLIASG
jgi:hypothetical protein